jgi:hypothetical protein
VYVALVVLSVLLALGFLGLGGAKVLGVSQMADNARHLGYPLAAFKAVGAMEIGGAAGLLVGLYWPPLGIAASTGLLLLLAGAAASHLRAGDGIKEITPVALFAALLIVAIYLRFTTA